MSDRIRSSGARARAGANIALVKYWGKRDLERNLPAGSSLSLTLGELETQTAVTFDPGLERDEVRIDGVLAPLPFGLKVSRFLDRVRARAGIGGAARVETSNSFPTASGLASSASGFAALAAAASCAASLDLEHDELAELARLGSGSAARSLLGGFVEMRAGERADGADCRVRGVADERHWALRLVVAVVGCGAKTTSSTEGMLRTAATSPLYSSFLEANEAELARARRAVLERDLETLGTIAERSCLRMHAAAAAADPGVLYWRGATVEAMHAVLGARRSGLPGYFTVDAGPHVKVLCETAAAGAFRELLAGVPGIDRVIVASPGRGVEVQAYAGADCGPS